MGNLHKWFSGSKSKDGKSGWVNVKTGGTCASDEPGEGTPKCVSSSKRDSMTKSERESASSRKKSADPGQQQKSGAAKPTYVSTDKPKKMKKEQFSNWRDDYVATEHESIDLIKPEPMVGISETKEGQMKAGREQYKKEKEEGRYGGTKPSNEKVAKLMKKLKEETKQDGPEPTRKQTRGAMKDIRSKINTASHKDPDKKKTKQELAFQKARAKAWGMSEGKESERDKEVAKYRDQAKKKTTMPDGDVGHDIHKRAVDQYNKQNPSKKVKEEVEISEEDKKGSGSGKKDACYNKVKASAKVWPSAYASGRLVQCRKKGADSYGNSKNEEFSAEGYKGKHGQSDKEAMDSRSDAAKQISGDSKSSGAEYSHRSYRGVGNPAAPGERQKNQGKMTDADRDELAIRKNELKKREAKKKEKLEELKCWKGYKRKKGSTPGAPGSCVKEGLSSWRDDLDLMEGVGAWQRKEGKNKAGGLNEKGRKSYERENPGSDLKAPQPEGGSRKKSFCARMGGVKGPMKDEKGKPTRKALALRKWKC